MTTQGKSRQWSLFSMFESTRLAPSSSPSGSPLPGTGRDPLFVGRPQGLVAENTTGAVQPATAEPQRQPSAPQGSVMPPAVDAGYSTHQPQQGQKQPSPLGSPLARSPLASPLSITREATIRPSEFVVIRDTDGSTLPPSEAKVSSSAHVEEQFVVTRDTDGSKLPPSEARVSSSAHAEEQLRANIERISQLEKSIEQENRKGSTLQSVRGQDSRIGSKYSAVSRATEQSPPLSARLADDPAGSAKLAPDVNIEERFARMEDSIQRLEQRVVANVPAQSFVSNAESDRVSVLESAIASLISQELEERVGGLENTLQRMVAGDKISVSATDKDQKGDGRLGILEELVQHTMAEMSRLKIDMKKSEMRTGYPTSESPVVESDRCSMLESMITSEMSNLASQMERESERLGLFENKVTSELNKALSEQEKLIFEMRTGYASVDRLTILEDALQRMMDMNLQSQGYKASEWVTQVENKVTAEMQRLASEVRANMVSVDALADLEGTMQRMKDDFVQGQLFKASEWVSLLENKVGTEIDKVSAEIQSVEERIKLMVQRTVDRNKDSFEGQVQQTIGLNESESVGQLESKLMTEIGRMESEINNLRHYVSTEQQVKLAQIEERVQSKVAYQIENAASDYRSEVDTALSENDVNMRCKMDKVLADIDASIRSKMARISERVSLLEENKPFNSKESGTLEQLEDEIASQMRSGYAPLERFVTVEDTVQRMMKIGIESQISRQSEQVTMLQNTVVAEMGEIASEISKLESEMRSSCTPLERFTILEDTVQNLKNQVPLGIESQMSKQSEQVSVLQNKVVFEMAEVASEISNLGSEMRTGYAPVERLTILENMVQRIAMNVESRQSKDAKESERIGMLENEVASEMSNFASEIDKVASEMRAGYASVEQLSSMEGVLKSEMCKLASDISKVASTLASDISKVGSTMQDMMASQKSKDVSDKGKVASEERLSLLEKQVASDMSKVASLTNNLASDMDKATGDMNKLASEMRSRYVTNERITMMEDRLQSKVEVSVQDKVGKMECDIKEFDSRISKLFERSRELEKQITSEVSAYTNQIASEMVRYASIERLSKVEETLQNKIRMSIDSEMMKASERCSLLENEVAGEMNKVAAQVERVASELDIHIDTKTSKVSAQCSLLEGLCTQLEQQIASEISLVTSQIEKVAFDMDANVESKLSKLSETTYASVEQLDILEGTAQRMMEMNIESGISIQKESDRLTALENKVENKVTALETMVTSDMTKTSSDATFASERIKIVSDMVRNIEATISKESGRVGLLEDTVQRIMVDERVSTLENALKAKEDQAKERVGYLEKVADQHMAEINRLASEMRGYASVERLNIMEDLVKSMTEMNFESEMLKEAERLSMLENTVASEISKLASLTNNLASDIDKVTGDTRKSLEGLTMVEDFKNTFASEMSKVASLTNNLASDIDKVTGDFDNSLERLTMVEDLVQRMVEMNIQTQTSTEFERVKESAKEIERVNLLDDKITSEMSKVASLTSNLTSDIDKVVSEMRSSTERLRVMEGKVQGMIDLNVESQMLKEAERLSMLENTVTSALSKVTSEMRTGYVSTERLHMIEDRLRVQLTSEMEKLASEMGTEVQKGTSQVDNCDHESSAQVRVTLLEDKVQRFTSRLEDKMQRMTTDMEKVGMLEEEVNNNMSAVLSEVSKVATEMRTGYASVDRLTITEGMVQRMMEMNFESQMSKESERVGQLEIKVATVMSKVGSEMNTVTSAMERGGRAMEMNIESQLFKATEQFNMLDSKVTTEMSKFAAQLNRVVSEMNKVSSEVRTEYASEERVRVLESMVQRNEPSGFNDGIDSGVSIKSDRLKLLEDTINRIMAETERISTLEEALREKEQKGRERVSIVEEAVQNIMAEISKVAGEMNKVSSEMRTSYASVERLTIVEGTVQRMMEMMEINIRVRGLASDLGKTLSPPASDSGDGGGYLIPHTSVSPSTRTR